MESLKLFLGAELFIFYINEPSLLDENKFRVVQFLKSQAGKFTFANLLVMVRIVGVMTNLVVHSVTIPLSLWSLYFCRF